MSVEFPSAIKRSPSQEIGPPLKAQHTSSSREDTVNLLFVKIVLKFDYNRSLVSDVVNALTTDPNDFGVFREYPFQEISDQISELCKISKLGTSFQKKLQLAIRQIYSHSLLNSFVKNFLEQTLKELPSLLQACSRDLKAEFNQISSQANHLLERLLVGDIQKMSAEEIDSVLKAIHSCVFKLGEFRSFSNYLDKDLNVRLIDLAGNLAKEERNSSSISSRDDEYSLDAPLQEERAPSLDPIDYTASTTDTPTEILSENLSTRSSPSRGELSVYSNFIESYCFVMNNLGNLSSEISTASKLIQTLTEYQTKLQQKKRELLSTEKTSDWFEERFFTPFSSSLYQAVDRFLWDIIDNSESVEGLIPQESLSSTLVWENYLPNEDMDSWIKRIVSEKGESAANETIERLQELDTAIRLAKSTKMTDLDHEEREQLIGFYTEEMEKACYELIFSNVSDKISNLPELKSYLEAKPLSVIDEKED